MRAAKDREWRVRLIFITKYKLGQYYSREDSVRNIGSIAHMYAKRKRQNGQ